MTQTAAHDLDALRDHVRSTQHLRSFPLLVIGGLLINYGVVQFDSRPVAWRYGAPLAFVLVWALGKLNEARIGVGPGRADYLVAGGFVFAATNLVLLRPVVNSLTFLEIQGIWVAIVGVALAAIARVSRDRVLAAAALVVVATGVVVAVAGHRNAFSLTVNSAGLPIQSWPDVVIAVVGAAFVVAGLGLYRRERGEE